MAVHEVIPENDVKLSDIRDTLNAHGSSCTNDAISFFDERAVINHWSFRKPYATDLDLFKLTDEQIRSDEVMCGFTPHQIAAYTNLPTEMDGDMNGWVYNRPNGGENTPFRLGDYVGYYPEAKPMIRDLQVPAQISTQETTDVAITAVCTIPNKYSVSLSDLGSLKYYKAAVYLKHKTQQNQSRNRIGESLENGTFNVLIPISEFITGEWDVYPYITLDNTHYTIPNIVKQTIKVVTSNYIVTMTAEKSKTEQSISWSIRVNNKSDESVTFNNNNVYLRLGTKDFDDTFVDGEQSKKLADGLEAAGKTTTTIASGTFTNIADNVWKMPKLWASIGSGNYIGSIVPISEDLELTLL